MMWSYLDVSWDPALKKQSPASVKRAGLLQLMGGTLSKVQCVIYRPEWSESADQCNNKDRWVCCGKSTRVSSKS